MSRCLAKHFSANFQQLPRLPVPLLAETLNRYRQSVSSLKKKEVVERHVESIAAFEKGCACLQDELVARDKACEQSNHYPYSYIEEIWDDGYLGFRGPSPVNISPAFSLKPFTQRHDQATVAAKMAFAVVKWTRRAANEGVTFSPQIDISQLEFQFCTSRLPLEKRDSVTRIALENGRHITVLHDGHAYLLEIADEHGICYNEEILQKAFSHILNITPTEDHPAPVSVLTTGSRNDWAASYSELIRNSDNAEVLKKIQHSLIVVCLDSNDWATDVQKQQAMLFGGAEECENRWYDKHQVIVSKNGHVAFNFEHAFSDGMTWNRWIGDLWNDIEGLAPHSEFALTTTSNVSSSLVEPVKISFGKTFGTRIRNARQEIKSLIDNVEIASANIPVGKKVLKEARLSPDAFAQMCFHLGFFKMRGKLAPTYESCSTNRFFHGRTETIRTATPKMLALVSAIDSGAAKDEVTSLLYEAASFHVNLAKEASNGLGVDRHLLALKKLAEANGNEAALNFFKEELFSYSSTWLMSTSNVSQPFLEFFSFGPVADDGYGIGYIVDDDCIRCSISAFKNSTHSDANELRSAIETAGVALSQFLRKC